eukprot:58461-Prymnesium_polylepis.1
MWPGPAADQRGRTRAFQQFQGGVTHRSARSCDSMWSCSHPLPAPQQPFGPGARQAPLNDPKSRRTGWRSNSELERRNVELADRVAELEASLEQRFHTNAEWDELCRKATGAEGRLAEALAYERERADDATR